jgi:hypothetical protein
MVAGRRKPPGVQESDVVLVFFRMALKLGCLRDFVNDARNISPPNRLELSSGSQRILRVIRREFGWPINDGTLVKGCVKFK